MQKFRDLGIPEEIIRVIQEDGFEKPSEIQSKTIPLVVEGKDVIGGSATGSGKTLAFAAGIIKNCEHGKGVQALILTPTRELAEQVSVSIKHFSKHKPLKIISVYGGVSINPQIESLRHADVVVGTPGRILDHLERDTLILDSMKILVLDEADRMLDMGFIDDVVKIIRACPKERQTLLFSATIYDEVVMIASKYMHNPVEISAESHVDPKKLHQVFYDTPDNMKFSLLVHLLKKEKSDLVMVFCNTRKNTGFVVKYLCSSGIPAVAVHGGFSQDKRDRTMEDFHSKKIKVLVCTDVAARGLDIPGISHVYNYDLPKNSKEYVHRIGRTARAGKEGMAINILASRDYENFSKIQEDESLNIVKEELPSNVDRIFIKPVTHGSYRGEFRGGFRGERREGSGGYGRGRSEGEHRSYGRDRRDSGERGGKWTFEGQGRPSHGRPSRGGSNYHRSKEASNSRSSGRGDREEHRGYKKKRY